MTPSTTRSPTEQASWKEGVNNITGVINNQIIHPLKCEEQEMVNISTGHKAKSADLVRARG